MAKRAKIWTGSEWITISGPIVNPYPSTTGHIGKVLQTDGVAVSWQNTPFQWSELNNHWETSNPINLSSGTAIKFNNINVLTETEYSGNAATVTNGLYSNMTYNNPNWISYLSWNKISDTPTSLSEYGVTSVAWNLITSAPTTLGGYGIDVQQARVYLSINNVENTALSTWVGSNNITTLGTISTGTWNGSIISSSYIDLSIARLSSPTFSGVVSLPATTSIGTVSSTELGYLDGVTSSIQSQLNAKLSSTTASATYATLSNPSFTGTASLPSDTSIGNVSATEISYIDGVTSSIQTQLNSKAPLASPTFTGTVSGITKAMVGLANADDTSDANKPVSTAQQTALNAKANLSGDTFTGFITLHADPTQALHAATKQYVDAVAEGLHIHASAQTATTSNIPDLSNPGASIDGVTLTNNMRVLVKNQTTNSQNGIYVYNSSTGSLNRAPDFDTAAETNGGDFVFVTGGTQNDNSGWVQTETVSSIGTDPILFQQFSGAGTVTAGTNVSIIGNQISVINNPTFSQVVTASSGIAFSDGTQTKVAVPSISSFVTKTANYILDDLSLRDNIIEVNSSSATTITIPLDSAFNFPIGASLDIIQVGTGQVTISGSVGVTINATPGLNLRTQWSSCTLLKRSANTWIVYGDLKV